MEKKKAIEIFNKWMDCKDAFQEDPSCDGNCFSCEYYASAEEEKEAMQMAISALEKQEQDDYKCCETCRHKNRSSQEVPCCDCCFATVYEDYYEAEEES